MCRSTRPGSRNWRGASVVSFPAAAKRATAALASAVRASLVETMRPETGGLSLPPGDRTKTLVRAGAVLGLDKLLAASLVVEGDVTVTQAIDYLLDVLDGVAAAHERGVIHRDIKPANCFLDGEGRATIGDYGLALPLLDDPLEGRFAGTPAFASPEQIRVARLDERSDQYSLGATLYFVLARRPPFVGSFTSLIAQVAADSQLSQVGQDLYSAAQLPDADRSARVRQGFLETSNVESVQEMVRLIETMRHFETVQRFVRGYEDMVGKAITELGKV